MTKFFTGVQFLAGAITALLALQFGKFVWYSPLSMLGVFNLAVFVVLAYYSFSLLVSAVKSMRREAQKPE